MAARLCRSGIKLGSQPVERIDSYRKRWTVRPTGSDSVNETQVLAGQRERRTPQQNAGIPHESHEVPGVFRPDMSVRFDGIVARLPSRASGGQNAPIRPPRIPCGQRGPPGDSLMCVLWRVSSRCNSGIALWTWSRATPSRPAALSLMLCSRHFIDGAGIHSMEWDGLAPTRDCFPLSG